MNVPIKKIAYEFKRELQKLYGDDLSALVLFGSFARGDFHEESDVDFAVVLNNNELIATDEIFKITPISTSISLKYNKIVSFLPMSLLKFNESKLAIHRYIKTEGLTI